MQARLWTLNALAVELGRDRRTLARLLEDLPPDDAQTDTAGREHRRWRLARVIEHIYASTDEIDLNAERARLAKAQADRVEIENEVRAGRLLEQDRVIREVGDMLAAFRARVLAIPGAVAQRVPHHLAGRVQAELRRLIHEALTELADYRPGPPRPGCALPDSAEEDAR